MGIALAAPFSAFFWVCCLGGWVSDLLDGPVARYLNTASADGAKLDSLADLAFAAGIAITVSRNIPLPLWLWVCAGCVAAVRLAGYGAGFVKYHTFSALHTYANKATGALLFAFPLLYTLFGLTVSGVILCAAAFLSSAEELAITIRSPAPDRDCKGILLKKAF